MKLKPQFGLTITILTILFVAPTMVKADAVSDWNLIALQRIGAAVPARPAPVGFLDMAIVNAAMYDAVQAIEKDYQQYHAQIPGASGSPEVAAAKAAHDVLVNLFPGQTATIDTAYNDYLTAKSLSPVDPGVAVGAAAAAQIIALRSNDGRFPAVDPPFTGGLDAGQWRPTPSFLGAPPSPPSFAPMAAPWVANVTPFTLNSGDQFRAAPPPPLNSSEYTQAYNEAKLMGARVGSGRTPEETTFALFWAANYTALWNRVARELAASQNLNISDNSRLFALLTFSMADAIITAWDSKVAYNFWRPLTAIREGDYDTNPDTVGDPLWEPLINTPNYSDHTSGANNASGAATRALSLFFGTNEMTFTVTTTNAALGTPAPTRTYQKFSDAAEDVVVARIYEGIHFRFADEDARKQGRHVAQWAHGHFLKPIE